MEHKRQWRWSYLQEIHWSTRHSIYSICISIYKHSNWARMYSWVNNLSWMGIEGLHRSICIKDGSLYQTKITLALHLKIRRSDRPFTFSVCRQFFFFTYKPKCLQIKNQSGLFTPNFTFWSTWSGPSSPIASVYL